MKPPTLTAMYQRILDAGYYVSLSTSSNGFRHGCTVTLTAKRDSGDVRTFAAEDYRRALQAAHAAVVSDTQ